jgi:hypothetical protein
MSFLDEYLKYIKENSIEFSKNNVPVLSVSLPGFFGDAIEVFIEKKGSEITVHDNGNTIESLLDIGGNIYLNNLPFGCVLNGKVIEFKTSSAFVGEAVNTLIFACLSVYYRWKK